MIPKFISTLEKQLVLFDMDGVLAEYKSGEESDIRNEVPNVYLNKRPINTVINVVNDLYNMQNITVGILSSCDYPSQALEKHQWLAKYLPFIEKKNIYIVIWSHEKYDNTTKKYAKLDVVKNITGFASIFLLEDNHDNIKAINNSIPNCAHHVSEIID